MSEEHEKFNYIQEWHKGDDYGCYFKHKVKPRKYPPCDYALNGFNVSKTRTGMHNRDHRGSANRKGLLTPQGQAEVSQQVHDHGASRGKTPLWESRTMNRIYGPLKLLLLDPQAWYVNHQITKPVTPWWGKVRVPTLPPAENFLPQPHGGWHYFFPFKHNHHHMIPGGAFRDLVLDAEVAGNATPFTRRIAVLRGKWNLNNKNNIVLLPNEEQIARVAALPAHCPWEQVSHPTYTKTIKNDLEIVKGAVDKAADKEDHDEIEAAKIQLESTEKKLLKMIERMRGPL